MAVGLPRQRVDGRPAKDGIGRIGSGQLAARGRARKRGTEVLFSLAHASVAIRWRSARESQTSGIASSGTTRMRGKYSSSGRRGVHLFFEDARTRARIEARVEEPHDLGDRALVLGELKWRARTGGSLDMTGPLCSVVHFEGGRITRIHTYRQANYAWRAADLGRRHDPPRACVP